MNVTTQQQIKSRAIRFRVFRFIINFARENEGLWPTCAEISAALDISFKTAVRHRNALRNADGAPPFIANHGSRGWNLRLRGLLADEVRPVSAGYSLSEEYAVPVDVFFRRLGVS